MNTESDLCQQQPVAASRLVDVSLAEWAAAHRRHVMKWPGVRAALRSKPLELRERVQGYFWKIEATLALHAGTVSVEGSSSRMSVAPAADW